MTVSSPPRVRVWVECVWDTVELAVEPGWTIARLKAEALRAATGSDHDPGRFQVKLRGALVIDESRTLGDLGADAAATFVVLSARRRPVR